MFLGVQSVYLGVFRKFFRPPNRVRTFRFEFRRPFRMEIHTETEVELKFDGRKLPK